MATFGFSMKVATYGDVGGRLQYQGPSILSFFFMTPNFSAALRCVKASFNGIFNFRLL
jgi:hypothetical protein